MSKLLVHRAALSNMVRRIAGRAGAIVLDHADGVIVPDMKDDGSPVTAADHAAEEYIARELAALTPDVPIIGEECAAKGSCPVLSGGGYVWYVDAIDGTREFAAGGDDYTVNIGLVKDGVPVLGVVHAPALGEMYAGYTEEDGSVRAVRFSAETGKDKDIRARRVPRDGMVVLLSRTRAVTPDLEAFLGQYKVARITRRSSSLKLCAIAAGKADLYPCFGKTCAWDIVAGQAIVTAAGGVVVTPQGDALRYDPPPAGFENPAFVAAGEPIGELP